MWGSGGRWPGVAKGREAGWRYCPHYLGGGIGRRASAHVLAAAGGDGILEIDANPNPLRSALAGGLASVVEGHARLGSQAGLGVEPDLAALARLAAAGC